MPSTTGPASILTNGWDGVHEDDRPIELPQLLAVLERQAEAGKQAEREIPRLKRRIEANRLRSARAHANASEVSNGHRPHITLKLRARGLEPACPRCGGPLSVNPCSRCNEPVAA